MKRTIASILAAVPVLLGGCGGPMEQEQESVSAAADLGEVGAVEQRATTLSGSGVLHSYGSDLILYNVGTISDPHKVQIELRAAADITWWKSVDVFMYGNGSYNVHLKRIETKDNNRYATVDLFDHEMSHDYKLEFWKGGFMGFGAKVYTIYLNKSDTLGKRLTFTWEND